MGVVKKNDYGKIQISLDAIASVAGNAVMNVFGVVGLGTKRSFSDDINVFFNKERYKEGVAVKEEKGEMYSIDVYVILVYGAKISEVISEVQNQVRYFLTRSFDIKVSSVNVFVQGIKAI